MTVTLMMTIAIQGLVFGMFCAFIAKSKNRNMTGWYVLGFLFSIIALIALVGVPRLDPDDNTKALQRRSYRIILSLAAITVIFAGLAFAWNSLLLPESVYSILPSSTYKLKVVLDKYEVSYHQLQSKYDRVSGREQYWVVGEQISLVDNTIDAINSIDGLDDQTRIAHIASFSQLKFKMLELRGLLDQNYRYR